jgi:DNA-binding NarL/FixJ family response regulator
MVACSETAVAKALAEPYDLVICSVRAEPLSGLEVAAKLEAAAAAPPLVLLADPEDQTKLLGALGSGAAGFFTHDVSVEEFVLGIRAVLDGHYVIARSIAHEALAQLTLRQDSERRLALNQLSPVERKILALVGQAHSIRSIAEARGISQKTVRNHLAHVYRKLQLHGRTEAVLLTMRSGLLEELAADGDSSRRPSAMATRTGVAPSPAPN